MKNISTAEVYCDSERRRREPVVKSERSEWRTAFGVNNLRGFMQLTRKQLEKLDGEENRVNVREGLWVLLLKNDPFATQRFERKFQHFKNSCFLSYQERDRQSSSVRGFSEFEWEVKLMRENVKRTSPTF